MLDVLDFRPETSQGHLFKKMRPTDPKYKHWGDKIRPLNQTNLKQASAVNRRVSPV